MKLDSLLPILLAAAACLLPGTAWAEGPAQPIALDAAVQRALQRNPQVLVAIQEIRRAQGLLEQARSASLPTLTGNVTYTRLDANRVLPTATQDPANVPCPGMPATQCRIISAADQISANVTLAVPILVPQHWAQWWHASDALKIARIGADDARRQVAIATARAFLTTLAQHRSIAALEVARETARRHLEFSRARFRGGVGNRLDAVRAEQEVATDESQVQAAYSALAKDQEALGVLVGADHPLDAVEDPPLPGPPPLQTALSESQSRRADIQALRERQEAARRVVRDNWADYLPYLVGTFQPFSQYPPTLTVPTLGWQAQLILTVPFYDGGLRYGASKERWALYRQSQVNLEGALRQARSDVRVAFTAVQRADQSLIAAREAARLANEALGLANLAYRAGATTNLEVIDAERQARDAETAATVAEDAARQARLDLLIASGRFP